jgi:hypothetical protein
MAAILDQLNFGNGAKSVGHQNCSDTKSERKKLKRVAKKGMKKDGFRKRRAQKTVSDGWMAVT